MTMTWQSANRVAAIAATQAHDSLGLDQEAIPVSVAQAIYRAGIVLIYRPLPSLFGAYLVGAQIATGILVNNRLTRAARRHTAAHELGHHQFGHQCTVDDGAAEPSDSLVGHRRGAWPDEEKTAEAFAAWFLMPRRMVMSLLDDMGVAAPESAEQTYQLALRLGTSYAATVRHLATLKLISTARARQWSSVAPGTLKRRLADHAIISTRDVDVWDLGVAPRHTPASVASAGDLVLVPAGELAPYVDGPVIEIGRGAAGQRIFACTEPVDGNTSVSITTATSRFSLTVQSRPSGVFVPLPDAPMPLPGRVP